jgi:hypothetical protein
MRLLLELKEKITIHVLQIIIIYIFKAKIWRNLKNVEKLKILKFLFF